MEPRDAHHFVRVRPEDDEWRWYAVVWGPTLFGTWGVHLSWGRMDTSWHRQRTLEFDTAEEAIAEAKAQVDRRDKLKEIHVLGQEALQAERDEELDWEDLADMPEVERWRVEEERGGMRSGEEVERIAMEVAMAHERQRGWRPEDVSEENLGFDVRSHGPGGEVRRIEVKGRAGEGAVRLSPNEWLKAAGGLAVGGDVLALHRGQLRQRAAAVGDERSSLQAGARGGDQGDQLSGRARRLAGGGGAAGCEL